jgi:hypothetical protein
MFATTGITDIGRQLLWSVLAPLLNIGDTLLAFNSRGKIPVFIDVANIPVKGVRALVRYFSLHDDILYVNFNNDFVRSFSKIFFRLGNFSCV